jgi:ADP-ribose pyrophosphatase
MELFEKTIETRRIHEGRVINLREDTVELPNGRIGKREIIEHKGAVAIVPLLPDGRVIMVRQFRKPCEEALLEIPAGGLNKGEDPADCARRELSEETNHDSAKLTHLFSIFLAPGYSSELIHCYLAEELFTKDGTPDEDENLNVEIYPLSELLAMCDNGGIKDAKTVACLGAVYRRLNG